VASEHMLVFFPLPVISQHLKALRDSMVAGHDCTTVTVGAQILSRIKTERGSVSQRTGPLAFVASAMSLTSVFNNNQPVSLSQLQNRIHISWMTIKMDRDDGFRTRGNGFLECGDVYRVCV